MTYAIIRLSTLASSSTIARATTWSVFAAFERHVSIICLAANFAFALDTFTGGFAEIASSGFGGDTSGAAMESAHDELELNHIRICICKYMYIYGSMYIYMYVYVYTYIYAYTCIYVYIYIYVYMRI